MQAKFILKSLSQSFYERFETLNSIEQWNKLTERNGLNLTPKIGLNNTISESIEFNLSIKNGLEISLIEKRKGFNIITFNTKN